jgi:hypothetical protein
MPLSLHKFVLIVRARRRSQRRTCCIKVLMFGQQWFSSPGHEGLPTPAQSCCRWGNRVAGVQNNPTTKRPDRRPSDLAGMDAVIVQDKMDHLRLRYAAASFSNNAINKPLFFRSASTQINWP